MKYAVISLNNVQYMVKEGEELLVDKLEKDFDLKVLLYVDGDELEIGKPYLEKRKITTEILKDVVKGDKIRVLKYKAKSRYRKRFGFRATLTKIKINKIF